MHADSRYGNLRVFEEINRLSREILIKTKDIVQKLGCELIYADTTDLATAMTNGETYVNVHTDQNPNGEICGQIMSSGSGEMMMSGNSTS